MTRKIILGICVIGLTILQSCNNEEIKRLDFEELLDKRYSKVIDDRLVDCKEKAMVEAESKVDTLIDKLLKKDLIDSLPFPEKPIRPDRPENIIEQQDKEESK